MKAFLFIFLILPISYFSQNFDSVIDASKFIEKPFSDFESNFSLKSYICTPNT